MADTKPGVVLDEEGVCQACRHYEQRKNIDYAQRRKLFEKICEKHHRNTAYDCIIPVSGGKDSHYQVHFVKNLFKMNPLLVTVGDPFTKTEAGKKNFANISEQFGCDVVQLHLNRKVTRQMIRIAFEEFGSPTWPIDRAIYCFPIRLSIQMNIPLVIYGENVNYEYGGIQTTEVYSAKEQINNDVAKSFAKDWWLAKGVKERDFNQFVYPVGDTNPIYLSYFVPWDGYANYSAAQAMGFTDLTDEWKRDGYIESYDQIDSVGYLINVWLKYPKFGFARATDVVGYWIRSGRIDKEKGAALIREHDHKLDERILQDFLSFTGYTKGQFFDIVERFWNTDIFEKTTDGWKLKKEAEINV